MRKLQKPRQQMPDLFPGNKDAAALYNKLSAMIDKVSNK
jgi:hypothetical protein